MVVGSNSATRDVMIARKSRAGPPRGTDPTRRRRRDDARPEAVMRRRRACAAACFVSSSTAIRSKSRDDNANDERARE